MPVEDRSVELPLQWVGHQSECQSAYPEVGAELFCECPAVSSCLDKPFCCDAFLTARKKSVLKPLETYGRLTYIADPAAKVAHFG